MRTLSRLLGWVLLRGLAAIDHAGELKPDGKFPDVPIVITEFLEWSRGCELEDDAVEWCPHAAAYFKKGEYDISKGIASTKKLLDAQEEEGIDERKIPGADSKDLWGWKKELKRYKDQYAIGGKIGGTRYDITKMSRTERAKHAFDNEDPLKDVSTKDLKEGNLDFD